MSYQISLVVLFFLQMSPLGVSTFPFSSSLINILRNLMKFTICWRNKFQASRKSHMYELQPGTVLWISEWRFQPSCGLSKCQRMSSSVMSETLWVCPGISCALLLCCTSACWISVEESWILRFPALYLSIWSVLILWSESISLSAWYWFTSVGKRSSTEDVSENFSCIYR